MRQKDSTTYPVLAVVVNRSHLEKEKRTKRVRLRIIGPMQKKAGVP